jgi:mono/diheme cytochrome c family protein
VGERPLEAAGAEGGGARVGRNLVVFVLLVIGFYVFTGVYVQSIVGGGGGEAGASGAGATGVSVDAGQAVFWGKGKCSTCHALGDQGSAVRCPNLEGIGATAAGRAEEAGLPDATAYLVESLHEPSSYVVEGYGGDTMPKVYQPPISLSGDEIRAVILYLQSQGGTPDEAAISLPAAMEAGGGEGAAAPAVFAPYMTGDPEAGRALFYEGRGDKMFADGAQACGVCHTVAGEGGTIGPEITDIVAVRGQQYVITSVLDPAAEVVANYPPVMPPTFAEVLTTSELHDILAFLTQSAGQPLPAGETESEGEG